MPEGCEHINAAYLGELPWATAARENADSWSCPRFPTDKALSLKVIPTWAEYLWEGRTLDCSIDDNVRAQWPNPILLEAGELSGNSSTREWHAPDGKLMAQYQETSEHSILLVREDWFQQTLQKINCSVVFGCLGEKSLCTKDVPSKSVGRWTPIDAIATFVDAQWHFGKPRLSSVEL